MGENLRDPLSEITEMVSASAMPKDYKDAIIEKIRGANQIIDLALGTTGELELNRCMENMGEFLSQFKCYADPTPLPCLMFDESRLRQAFEIVLALMDNNALIRASMTKKGVRIDILSNGFDWNPPKDDVGLLLAHEIFLMHGGSCTTGTTGFCAILPYPTLSGSYPSHWNDSDVLACINGRPPFEIEDAVMEDVNGSRLAEKKRLPSFSGAIYWDSAFKGYHALSVLMCLTSNVVYRNMPFLCMDCPRSRTLEDSIRSSVEEKGKVVLQIGSAVDDLYRWLQAPDVVTCELKAAAAMCKQHEPVLVMLSMEGLEDRIDDVVEFLETLRGMRRISQTPTIICTDHLDYPVVNALADIPNIIVVNTCMLESDEFAMRVRAVLGGSELLATNTGAIVKKAQAYLCSHATMSISRWQVAEDVHVSEDYLTRVFKKELGLSPWDYLNRYRIWLACSLLMNTGMSINEIASATGFQDQAYFCRVFKKIRGYSPSKMRSGRKSELSKI